MTLWLRRVGVLRARITGDGHSIVLKLKEIYYGCFK
jgi:hypothetical protein